MPNFPIPGDVDMERVKARLARFCTKFPAISEEIEKVKIQLREENTDKDYDNLEEFVNYSIAELLGLSKVRASSADSFYFPSDFENAAARLSARPELFAKMQEEAQKGLTSSVDVFDSHLAYFTSFTIMQKAAQESDDLNVKFKYVKTLERFRFEIGDDIDFSAFEMKNELANKGHIQSCLEVADSSKIDGDITKAAFFYSKAFSLESDADKKNKIRKSLIFLTSSCSEECRQLNSEELQFIMSVMKSDILLRQSFLTNDKSGFFGDLVGKSADALTLQELYNIEAECSNEGASSSCKVINSVICKKIIDEGSFVDEVDKFSKGNGFCSDGVIVRLSGDNSLFSFCVNIEKDGNIDEIARKLRRFKTEELVNTWQPCLENGEVNGIIIYFDRLNLCKMIEYNARVPSSSVVIGKDRFGAASLADSSSSVLAYK